MERRHWSRRYLIAAAGCLAIGGQMGAQERLQERTVLAGEHAYVLLPAELASGPAVVQAKWSADGRYVLSLCRAERIAPAAARARALQRDPAVPSGDLKLVVYSRETHRSQELWHRPLGQVRIEECRWLPGSDRAYAIFVETPPGMEPRRRLLWIRAGLESVRVAATLPFGSKPATAQEPQTGAIVEASPAQSLAFIRYWTLRELTVRRTDGTTYTRMECEDTLVPIGDNGATGVPVRIPGAAFLSWAKDGRTCYLQRSEWPTDPKERRPKQTWFEFDPRTGQWRTLPAEPPDWRETLRTSYAPGQTPPEVIPDNGPVRLVSAPTELKQADGDATLRPLWLASVTKSEQPRALVCADARWSRLSPIGDAVLYIGQDAAWMRPVLCVSPADYAAMLREEARRQAVADAMILSQALNNMVNSGEYYPRPDQLRDWLTPYLRDSAGLLDRLVYTHGAGTLLPEAAQATTVLGHVNGPGGRAVIFADGRAVWRDD